MDIYNPSYIDHIIDINGNKVKPEELTNAEVDTKTAHAKNLVFKDDSVGTYFMNQYLLSENGDIIVPKILNIGDWDMNATAFLDVAHGLGANWKNILSITGIIRNDTDDMYCVIGRYQDSADPVLVGAGISEFGATNIRLRRRTGGAYDNIGYDSTPYNRGILSIWYRL